MPPANLGVVAQQSTELEAADEATAALLAFRKNRRVLVTGLTSETTRTWALPNGTFQAELHAAPVRTRDTAGDWVAVDLNLEHKPDGTVGPKAHARGVSLSRARPAGADTLVSLGRGAQVRTLGWRGALPEPVLDGPKATYVEVQPGVDLMIEVGRTGYQYFVVLKTPSAAASLARIAMPWDSGGSAARIAANGAVEDGPLVVSEAYMWDARVSPETGEPAVVAEVEVSTEPAPEGDGTDLVLTPDPDFLADPEVEYPVTVDPRVNLEPAFDAFVQDTIANTDMSGSHELKLGRVVDPAEGCASPCLARSFLSFHNLGGYRGSQVVKAELFLWNFHSYSCTAAAWQAWRVGYVTTSARWGNQPIWHEPDGTSAGTKGYNSNCADGWVSVSVKDTFQDTFSSASSSTANVGLRAKYETGSVGWKKFRSSEAPSNNPYVELLYNRVPNQPDSPKIDSCYLACVSPAVVRSGTPAISVRPTDPDGGSLRVEYEVYDDSKTILRAKSGTAVTGVPHGTSRWWTIVPLAGDALPDATYHWRARACDSFICGDYSGWFTFVVDTDDVSLPEVSGDPYLEKSTGTWNGGPGQAGTFTLGPGAETNVAEYAYSLNGGDVTTVPAGAAQPELLTANQQTVTTDLTGFVAGSNSNLFHSSAGHDAAGSVRVNPNGSGDSAGAQGDTFAAIGGDAGGLRLGMQTGKRYWITGWIYVPETTGLTTTGTYGDPRGLRIVGVYKNQPTYSVVVSQRAAAVNTWQRLSLVLAVPTNATEAFVRLYNGHATGSGKAVWWDDLSVREVIGQTAAEEITPIKDGLNVLSVQSRNAAGGTSDPKIYRFLVTPSSGSWHWNLDEGSGTTAASAPAGRPATLSAAGAAWSGPGRVGAAAVTLDGTGQLATADPVLDTTASGGFTVATWVQLPPAPEDPEPDPEEPEPEPEEPEPVGWRTAVSQDGEHTSMFRLGLRDDYLDGEGNLVDAWCFGVAVADEAGATTVDACTTDLVSRGAWVSLAGVYDKPTNTIKLHVNGSVAFGGTQAVASMPSGWSASGHFALGRAWDSGAPAENWIGDIDHVYAVQSVWPDSRIDQHAFGF